MPTPIISAIRCEPPYEKNGKGMPVNGKIPIVEAIFIKACSVIQKVIPMAVIFENLSLEFLAILIPK